MVGLPLSIGRSINVYNNSYRLYGTYCTPGIFWALYKSLIHFILTITEVDNVIHILQTEKEIPWKGS